MLKMALHSAIKGKLISVIGDEVRKLIEMLKICKIMSGKFFLRIPVLDFFSEELEKSTKIVILTLWSWIKVS